MNRNIAGFKNSITTLMAPLLFAVVLLASPAVLAAVHHIALTAEILPNGQLAYKLANSEKAVIPGPTIFVKRGDRVNVTLTNNTAVPVGFSIPGRPLLSAAAQGAAGCKQKLQLYRQYTVGLNT